MLTGHAISRRRFLAKSASIAAGATAFPLVVPSSALGKDGATLPSNRIAIGQVGFGWIGGDHLRAILGRTDVQYVAACDVNSRRLQQVKQEIETRYSQRFGASQYHGCATFGDFRQMLARPDLDAVIIATPDHWHAIISIEAAKAGKDIYCEKPMSLTIREGREVVNAVRRYGRVFQTGSQQRSSVFGPFRYGCELVRSGRIGKVISIDVSTGDAPILCDLPPEPTPDYFDWDMWLGQTPQRPYHSKLASISWRPYAEFCGGGFADMGAHHFDIAQWALDMDDSGPIEVLAPDPTHNRPRISFRYANGVIMNHVGGNCLGLTFYGADGTLYVGRDGLWTKPENIARERLSSSDTHLYLSNDHHGNWLDCIRSRQRCVADVEIGHRSATVCHLGNIAYALGRSLKWDPANERFLGDDAANRMLARSMRSPWCV